jgi:hypothetical protein
VLKRMSVQHEHANLHFFADMEAALAFAKDVKPA